MNYFVKSMLIRRKKVPMLVYALDIGGSSIKHGLIELKRNGAVKLRHSESVDLSSRKFDDLKEAVMQIIASAVKEDRDLVAIGISTTGSVDTKGIVVSAGHFEDYANVSWKKLVRAEQPRIRMVSTSNDGRASAWGEYISYNNKGKSHIHVVVGTGVGGGIIYNNELLMGDSGQAGYIGHIKVSSGETIFCSCGKHGCVETLASAPGIVQHYRNLSANRNLDDFGSVLSLAKGGNSEAVEAIKLGGYWLGVGIGNAMNVLNPAVVTIGGGVVSGATELLYKNNSGIYFDSVMEGAKYASHKRVFSSCDIRRALHGNQSGMIGAAHLTYLNNTKHN